MKFVRLSDIHGNCSALEVVLEDMNKHGVSEAVNLGDSLSVGLIGELNGRL